MPNSLMDLYAKYRRKMMGTLESDQYYQYLFQLTEAGDNTLQQTNQILHKVVDEKWLTKIEEGISAIDAIISKPRRFIAANEELVPVGLAKKITSDSVRHLARNTQYISDIQDGSVMPSKILNITTEDSYDLYENRFINTLIHKLAGFVEKRTDVIFWSTGDETRSILKMDSQMEDDYEEISYKMEMTIKHKQSYMETDAQHMEVFKRIDRVHRIVSEFLRSPFAQIMKDMPPVRSPIQRTNLIMKEPNFRKCYGLWTFLEQYDDVGYSIDVKETALDFDEEYLYQVYGNMIINYVVFKSLLEDDRRPIDRNVKRRRTVKPKFVKQIVEEFVEDYDLPDVEIRRVIVEEITKAQLEIERRQQEEEKKRAAREKAKEKARLAKEKEREKLRAAREKEREKQRLAKEKERKLAQAARQKELEKERARKAKEREKARLAKQKEREKEKARRAKEKEREKEKARRAKEREREKARLARERQLEKAKLAKAKAREKTKGGTKAGDAS